MTAEEFAISIRRKIDRLQSDDKPLRDATASAHGQMAQRIFEKGQTSDESNIGSYSTKDIWINPDKTATRNKGGFNPLKGKNGNTEFKTNPARVRKTSYFEGWKGLRSAQGLPTDNVNLNFTGEMRSDFSRPIENLDPFKVANNEYVFRFTAKPELNNDKARGNEAHFNKTIFKLSKQERDTFYRVATAEIRRLLEQ
jgi:hypothetical protein